MSFILKVNSGFQGGSKVNKLYSNAGEAENVGLIPA